MATYRFIPYVTALTASWPGGPWYSVQPASDGPFGSSPQLWRFLSQVACQHTPREHLEAPVLHFLPQAGKSVLPNLGQHRKCCGPRGRRSGGEIAGGGSTAMAGRREMGVAAALSPAPPFPPNMRVSPRARLPPTAKRASLPPSCTHHWRAPDPEEATEAVSAPQTNGSPDKQRQRARADGHAGPARARRGEVACWERLAVTWSSRRQRTAQQDLGPLGERGGGHCTRGRRR
jgi:hypothetical protein